MKRKLSTKLDFFNLRALIGLLLCAATVYFILIPIRSGLAFLNPRAPATASQRTLRFEERVFYQRAIEEVYWRHRIWPKERSDLKPSLDAVISQAQIEKKVRNYLRNSQALADYSQRPLTTEQLRLRWIAWRKTPGSQKCYRSSLKRSGTIPLLLRSVSQGPS